MPVVAHSKSGFVKNAVDVVALAGLLEGIGMAGSGRAYLERVNAFPGQGVGSMFSLGMSFWGAAGVLAACGIPCQLVAPQDWKRHFGLEKDKADSLALARRYFPNIDLSRKKDHGRAEALLIARYGAELDASR